MLPPSRDPRSPNVAPIGLSRIEQERDFYRKMLELGQAKEIRPFLEEALALIVQMTGVRRGYVELVSDPDAGGEPAFWVAHGCQDADVAAIRAAFSRGVIAEAIVTGRTIITVSALEDPRFQTSKSVQRNRIEAVICAPVGAVPPAGVVYLQDQQAKGLFTERDRDQVETFARHLAPFVDRLLLRRHRRTEDDPTLQHRHLWPADVATGTDPGVAPASLPEVTPYKGLSFQEATRRFQADLLLAALEETGWNVTEAAARLDLARSHAYKLVRGFSLRRAGDHVALG